MKSDENVRKKHEDKSEEVFQKSFIKTPEFLMASSYISSIKLPEQILTKARSIFSKYSA
jgi:hypothetical protein